MKLFALWKGHPLRILVSVLKFSLFDVVLLSFSIHPSSLPAILFLSGACIIPVLYLVSDSAINPVTPYFKVAGVLCLIVGQEAKFPPASLQLARHLFILYKLVAPQFICSRR